MPKTNNSSSRRSAARSSKKNVFSNRWVPSLRLINFMLAFAVTGALYMVFTQASLMPGYYGSVENDQFYRINSRRASLKKSSLSHIECLNSVAEQWTIKMSNAGKISHNPNLAADIDRLCGAQWSTGAENVGVTSSLNSPIEASGILFNAFVKSTGHRANIDRSDFTHVGLGAYINGSGKLYVTQVFAKCVGCTGTWTTTAVVPADPAPPVTISGRLYNLSNATGYGSIGIETCLGKTVTTASDGRFSFTAPKNSNFCVRAKTTPSGVNGPYLRPERLGYRNCPAYAENGTSGYCTTAGTTYEYQVAGASCYNNTANCGTGKIGGNNIVLSYDRGTDAGYNIVFAGGATSGGTTTATTCTRQINFTTISGVSTFNGPTVQTTSTTTETRYYYYRYANPVFYNHQITAATSPGGTYTHKDANGVHGILYDYAPFFRTYPTSSLTPRISYNYIYTYSGTLYVKRVSKSTGAVISDGPSSGGASVSYPLTTSTRKNTTTNTVSGPTLSSPCQ